MGMHPNAYIGYGVRMKTYDIEGPPYDLDLPDGLDVYPVYSWENDEFVIVVESTVLSAYEGGPTVVVSDRIDDGPAEFDFADLLYTMGCVREHKPQPAWLLWASYT